MKKIRLRKVVLGLVSFLFFFGFVCFAEDEGQMILARNGKTNYVIVVGSSPTTAEQFAVEELASFLGKATGASFPIKSETDIHAEEYGIYVGWTEFARKQGIEGVRLGAEEWVVRTVGKNLILTGGRPRGVLYAVYEFLEQQVGYHWLDEFTTVVPSKPFLTLKKLDIRNQPVFRDRQIFTMIEYGLSSIKVNHFRVRNKDTRQWPHEEHLGFMRLWGTPGGGHTFYFYSKDWPLEYLAMNAAGERVVSTSASGPGQICLTHPGARKLMLQRLEEFIASDRQAPGKPPRLYNIFPNDVHWICQCAECKAFSEREEADSGPLIDFVNFLADGIKEKYPDIILTFPAYSNTIKPPKTVRTRENVMIRVAQLSAEWAGDATGRNWSPDEYPDLFRPLTHPINRTPYETLRAWSKTGKIISIWDYWVQYLDPFLTPYVNLSSLQPDLQLFRDLGVEIIFVECVKVETSSFFALKRWVGLKLMQNPNQDVELLIKTFMEGYYGAAAGKMIEYLNYLEDQIAAAPGNLSGMKPHQRTYLNLKFFKTVQQFLDEAEALLCGTNEAALLNVRRERIPVDAALYAMWEQLEKQGTMPWDKEDILRRYESNRLAWMKARRSEDLLQKGIEGLPGEIKQLREISVTEKRKAEKLPVLLVPSLADDMAAGDAGKIDWAKAIPMGQWRTAFGGEIPERRIKGAMIHDSKYLYISLQETNIDTSKLSKKWWAGDGWELFFAPRRGQRGNATYRQLAINPEGEYLCYAYEGRSRLKWVPGVTVKSHIDSDRWQVLISIPLSDIIPGGVKTGQPFYANVIRATPSPGEHMFWSPVFEWGFHDLSRLVEIRFAKDEPENVIKNPGFEEGLEGWSVVPWRPNTLEPEIDKTIFQGPGHASVNIVGKEGKEVFLVQSLPRVKAKRYKLSGWIKKKGFENNWQALIQGNYDYKDEEGQIKHKSFGGGVTSHRASEMDWEKFEGEVEVHEGVFSSIQIYLRTWHPSGKSPEDAPPNRGTVWFDNISLIPLY